MADIKWIKLSVEMFDDEKIKLIRSMPEGNAIIVVWIQLLSLAGKTNDSGMIYIARHMAYSEEMLATIFNHPLNVIRLALQTLQSFGLIEVNPEGVINISNWEKHQSTDKMARMKEQARIRQQKHYYRNRLRELGFNVDEEGFTDDLDKLKELFNEHEEPNVRQTLPNALEVRSKKEEVRSKKIEDRSNKDILSGKAEPHIPFQEIVEYLNEKVETKYRHTGNKTQTLIKARYSEGFSLDDFKKVIDIKVNEWLNDKSMNKYLRPETLFGTKFESYLNQKQKGGSGGYDTSEYDDFF